MTQASTIEPTADEGIPSVSQIKKNATGAKIFLGLAVVIILAIGAAAIALNRYQAQRRAAAEARQPAAQLATAAGAGAGPLKVTGNAAGSPPAMGGVGLALASEDPRTRLGTGPAGAQGVFVPAIDPAAEPGALEPRSIGVRAGGAPPAYLAGNPQRSGGQAPQAIDPLDAPVLLTPAPALAPAAAEAARALAGAVAAPGSGTDGALAQSREQLEQARARLDQLVRSISTGANAPAAPGALPLGARPAGSAASATAAEDALKLTSTARVGAARLVAPAFTLPRGTTFTCALGSKIVSEQAGPVSCVVARNVYGHDGRVLLIERGSHLNGAYRVQAKVGQTRITVVWERLRMPNGVVVDVSSPATGPLGEAGVDGAVDNHWPERIGAALLLSFLDDAVKVEVAREQAQGNAAGTVVLQGSGTESSSLAAKVLDSTINIAPTIVKNQGEIVAVSVAQDVDFSTVYELHAARLP